jgi:integrase
MKRQTPRRDRLVGFSYDEPAGVAQFSMYVPGTAGRERKRATVRPTSYDEAVRLWFARYQRSKHLFLVALETGIRSGDLRRLALKHVDLAEGWIRLVQQKTGREVVIPISRECRLALEHSFAGRSVGADDYRRDEFAEK